jgi:X-Pro dipeptidyl-peptidase (S15 family)/X-Pro dipeptidyl-peptidase C-terminal non-catalytic domain
MRKIAAAAAACAALLIPSAAVAAPPNPFGHPCSDQNGVRFCPASTLDDRVPTWDGVPIDVDVTLPAQGDGPFPTIVMVHGLGQSKTAFETVDETGTGLDGRPSNPRYHYNNVFYANRGYAVVNLTERGYGNSCGRPDSRTSPGCDAGWQHLDDQAYEGRDIQYLLGRLVDEGVSQANALGVTGISYGGGITNILAYLKDRVRQPDGSFVGWTSPNGTPLQINAAWGRWGWADLTYSLTPNGRFLDTKKWKAGDGFTPGGIFKQSFMNGLYLISSLNFLAPVGDPNSDLTTAYNVTKAGEPYGADLQRVAALLSDHKSAAGLFGSTPAPLLLEDGWTDDLFTPQEALMIYGDTDGGKKGPVSLQFGDLGHGRGANKLNAEKFFNDQGATFFDAYLKHQGTPPAAGSASVFTQTCPVTQTANGPYTAASWAKLHPGTFKLAGQAAERVTSSGGDPIAAQTFDKVLGGDPCVTAPANKGKGTARYSAKVKKGFTLLGLPTIKATIKTKGSNGQLDARLYDIFKGKETLVTRGEYRLTNNQTGKLTFELNGGGWKFAKGHTVELEVLGQDPNYMRKSNGRFSVTLSRLTATLPTREKAPL